MYRLKKLKYQSLTSPAIEHCEFFFRADSILVRLQSIFVEHCERYEKHYHNRVDDKTIAF